MIHLDCAIIVEGRYDKNKLKQIFDALVLDTGGFGIFKDEEKAAFIRQLARTKGILVLTDSDHAGFFIRNYLKNIAAGGRVYHAYTPDLFGKEKRKQKPSKEGKLGVEGVPDAVIIEAVRRSGAPMGQECAPTQALTRATKADFYALGLSGGPTSVALRARVLAALELPENMTTNALLEAVNLLWGLEYLEDLVLRLQTGEGKK